MYNNIRKLVGFVFSVLLSYSAMANCPNSKEFKWISPKSSNESQIVFPGWETYIGVTGHGRISKEADGKLQTVRIAGKFFPAGCEKENTCTKVIETTDIYCKYKYSYPNDKEEKVELHSVSHSATVTFGNKNKWLCVESTFSKPLCICNEEASSSNDCFFH